MTEENNSSEGKYQNKVIIKGVKINNIEYFLNKKNLIGSKVSGLIKIIINKGDENINPPEKGVIVFKGVIKKIVGSSEVREYKINQALRKHQNELSREFMRKKRSPEYNKQIEKYFPKEDLKIALETIGVYKNYINRLELNHIIFSILNKKGVPIEEQKNICYRSRLWQDEIKNLMKERGFEYSKKGDKYFKTSGQEKSEK